MFCGFLVVFSGGGYGVFMCSLSLVIFNVVNIATIFTVVVLSFYYGLNPMKVGLK